MFGKLFLILGVVVSIDVFSSGDTGWSEAVVATDAVNYSSDVWLVDAPGQEQTVALGVMPSPAAPSYSYYSGSAWTTAASIPMGESSGVLSDIFLFGGYATWADSVTGAPYFSIYDGTSWSTPVAIPLGDSSGAGTDVITCTDGEILVAAWSDSVTKQPYYSVYQSGSWLPAALPIPKGESLGASRNVFLYNPPYLGVVAAWTDSSQRAFYTIFSGSSWSATNLIPLGSAGSAVGDVTMNLFFGDYFASPTVPESLLAVWKNADNIPYVASFDGSWTDMGALPLGTSTGVKGSVNLNYLYGPELMVFVWADSVTSAVYSCNYDGNFGLGTALDMGMSTGANDSVSLTSILDGMYYYPLVAWADSMTHAPYYCYLYRMGQMGEAIPLGGNSGCNVNITLNTNSLATTALGAWGEYPELPYPYYSAYNGTEWSAPQYIPLGASVGASGIFGAYNSQTNQVFATWADYIQVPYYSIYDGSSWTTAAVIPVGASAGVYETPFVAFNDQSNEMFVAWTDSITNFPYYSKYNGSWSAGSPISLVSGTTVYQDVWLACDSTSGDMVAAWSSGRGHLPLYSMYNGSWSPASPIPLGASGGAAGNVTVAYDPSSGQVFAGWVDPVTMEYPIYYSSYNGSSWMTGAIDLGTSVGGLNDVIFSYDVQSQQLFAAWTDESTQAPYYSRLNGFSWSPGEPIPIGESAGANGDIALAYSASTKEMMAAWVNNVIPTSPYMYVSYGHFSPSGAGAGAFKRPWNRR